MQGSLEEDLTSLRKLRDDDESGALKEFFGDSDDPREWKYQYGKVVTVTDGRVTGLSLYGCTKLTALPLARILAIPEVLLERSARVVVAQLPQRRQVLLQLQGALHC